MISLGHFSFEEHVDGGGEGDPNQVFLFLDSPWERYLFAAPDFKFKANLHLGTRHNAAGGILEYLDLEIYRYETREGEDYRDDQLGSYAIRYLLTFLAGVQPFEHAQAVRTMADWVTV